MKIKEVCMNTRLKDKTIRYYIRSGLIFPKYDENYTGRKNFNFSDEDIERLNRVVILRKYHFSIKDIKDLFETDNPKSIVEKHLEICKNNSEEYTSIINKLCAIDNKYQSVSELCDLLNSEEVNKIDVPAVDNQTPYKIMYVKEKRNTRLVVALFLIIFCFAAVIFSMIFNNVKAVTNSSVLNIGKGFYGIRIIESDEDQTTYYIHDLLIEEDNSYIHYYDETAFYNDVNIDVSKNKIKKDSALIKADIQSEVAWVRIAYLYKDKYTGEIVEFDGSYWVHPDDSPTISDNDHMMSDNYEYQYEISFHN